MVDGIEIHALDIAYDHLQSFPRRIISFLQFYFKARRLGKALAGYDALIAYSAPLSVGILGKWLSRKLGIPLIFEVADVWPDVPVGMGILPRGPVAKWLFGQAKQVYDAARAIVVFSPGMKEQVVAHGVPPEKVHVIYNGVGKMAMSVFSEKLPGERPVRVLYAGTVGVANAVDQLVEAAHLLEKRGLKHLEFVIAGKGNDLNRVQARAQELGVSNLNFLDAYPRDGVSELLASADIGVVCFAPFPVLEANGATKFFDYLAAGLPVVINYRGWQAAVLAEHLCGLSSDQKDLTGFADNLQRLAEDAEIRREMGAKGRALVQAHYQRKELAAQELDLITSFRKTV